MEKKPSPTNRRPLELPRSKPTPPAAPPHPPPPPGAKNRAGEPGIATVGWIPVRVGRASSSTRSSPASFPAVPTHATEFLGEHRFLSVLLPLPSLTPASSRRRASPRSPRCVRRSRCPPGQPLPGLEAALGRPGGRPVRLVARPRARSGLATRPDASGCPPACSPAWPVWRPASQTFYFFFLELSKIKTIHK